MDINVDMNVNVDTNINTNIDTNYINTDYTDYNRTVSTTL